MIIRIVQRLQFERNMKMIDKEYFLSEICRLCSALDFSASAGKWNEYFRRMQYRFDPQSFSRVIDWLINNFEPRQYEKFPSVKTFFDARSQSYRPMYEQIESDEYSDGEIMSAWAHCYRLVWLITDRKTRLYYFENLARHGIKESAETKQHVIEYYRGQYKKLLEYLISCGFLRESLISESTRRGGIVPVKGEYYEAGISDSEICEQLGF